MGDSTPICRCRVLYLGSAVPRQSKDGLQGIQEPLRSLYPSEGAVGAKGIDSWLSVWSNGILLENVDENLKQITRFFPIESLHYCAAVRQVLIPERGNTNPEPKFLPLDSPFARMPRAQHPPIFAAILRRTTGIKVLECHVFICKREAAANALVRCCFHAYADNSYARQLETGSTGVGGGNSMYGTLKSIAAGNSSLDLTSSTTNRNHHHHSGAPNDHLVGGWRSRAGSTTTLTSIGNQSNGHITNEMNSLTPNIGGASNSSGIEGYTSVKNFYGSSADLHVAVEDADASLYNGDENHKVWNGSQDQLDSITIESPYEIFSANTSTLGRPTRARQMSMPLDVPPPPMIEDKKHKKEKKSSKSSSSQSLSGTLIRPKPIHPGALQRTHLSPGATPSILYGPNTGARQYHTISHRGFPHGPPMGHHHHPGMQNPRAFPHPHFSMPMQIPVMVPQQYATLQPYKSAKKTKKEKKNGMPVGMPVVPPMYTYNQGMIQQAPLPGSIVPQSLIGDPRPLAMANRKLAASMGNGLDDSGNSGAESPGGTGIYRRKGHLNERAFSYSIRQEHRSRSHGSLASLQFNPPDMKKEREIAQMVAGLDLNDSIDSRSIVQNNLQGNKVPRHNGLNATYSNSANTAIYSNGITPTSTFGKPRR